MCKKRYSLSRGYQILLCCDGKHVSYLYACKGLGFESILTCAVLRFCSYFPFAAEVYFLASRCHTEKQLFACIFLQINCSFQIVSIWLCTATSLTTVSWSWLLEFLVLYCIKYLMRYSFIFYFNLWSIHCHLTLVTYLVNCTTQYFP